MTEFKIFFNHFIWWKILPWCYCNRRKRIFRNIIIFQKQIFMIVLFYSHASESFEHNLDDKLSFNFFEYCLYTMNIVNITFTFFSTVYSSVVLKNDQIYKLNIWYTFIYGCFCFNHDKIHIFCHIKWSN